MCLCSRWPKQIEYHALEKIQLFHIKLLSFWRNGQLCKQLLCRMACFLLCSSTLNPTQQYDKQKRRGANQGASDFKKEGKCLGFGYSGWAGRHYNNLIEAGWHIRTNTNIAINLYFALISRKIREKKNIKATDSLILIWILVDLGIFIVIPTIILIIFSI